ncbi:MAG: hypothetical protein Q8868_01085 [Bacteroidota bacterium]|nr:hypothetical protein [Bacteroidota bacterium]
MGKTIVLVFIICLGCSMSANNQDDRPEIKDYLNQEIYITDNFSGQSITLIKENEEYCILRKFFGSGIPVIGSVKYKVVFNSDYQIAFSEIIESSVNNSMFKNDEEFILRVEAAGPSLYLNRLKIVIKVK